MTIGKKTLTEDDKNTLVMYVDRNRPENKQLGYISSWNDRFVFVVYEGYNNSQATSPEDLRWVGNKD